MDVLTMLKFWKSNTTSKVSAGTTVSDAETTADSTTISDHLSDYSDDDDDSFFELELALPSYNSKFSLSSPCAKKTSKNELNYEEERESEQKLKSKPQSPISILRSASPKLRVFMFGRFNKKSSKRVDEVFETESVSSNTSPRRSNSSLFTVKFKIEDGSIVPKFTRSISNSSNASTSPKIEKSTSDETSKRFSKDNIQKYINLMKPKSSKKFSDGEKLVASSPTRSSTTTNTTSFPKREKEEKQSSRFKAKTKQLGKCKSSSAMVGVTSPTKSFPSKNDCPTDGIEGAILHCKRSFTSSEGHSSLSRCSSDPSYEKSNQVSEEI